jgi:DNA replication protein DnaC
MGTVQIRNLMQDLKLQGMLESSERIRQEALKNNLTIDDVLDRLLSAEFTWREDQASARRLKASKLKRMPALEDFDFTTKRSITKIEIKELYDLHWLEQGRPLLLIGPTGVGKTFLAEALGHHACQRKKTTLFMSMSDLTEHQARARATSQYLHLRTKLSKPDVLILDDFGLRKLSTQEAHDFCELLKERTGEKSTIITTQLPIDHWPEVLEDPVIADSIVDRLLHIAVSFTMTGESYRKTQGAALDKKPKKQA